MLQKVFENIYYYLEEELSKKSLTLIDYEDLSKISVNHLDYLEAILHLGRPTLSELADKLGYTKPSVTIMVNKLIKQGFVNKVQCNEDKRVYYIEFTKKGEDIVQIQLVNYQEFAAKLTKVLTKNEVELLEQILSKGLKALK